MTKVIVTGLLRSIKMSMKELINKNILEIENKFNNEVVTYVRKFEFFYKAEDKHQDYYKDNSNYLNIYLKKVFLIGIIKE